MHVTEVEARVVASETGQRVESKVDTPLPVIGLFGSVALGEKTDLGARVELFRMEFDVYEGSLNAFYLGVNHSFTDTIGAGIGYNYYSMNLDSPDEGLRGSVEIRHHGPIVFASFTF
jgi:outer membrane translocation and assembly module TamA